MEIRDQQHPQEYRDQKIIDKLTQEGRRDYNLVELARLLIRYQNFPGARQIQHSLDRILTDWGLTQEELFALTREIHAHGQIYRYSPDGREVEDWS